MKIEIHDTTIDGVKRVQYNANEEPRGNIWTTYKKTELRELEEHYDLNFHHDKFSISNYNVFRGFHGDHKSTKLVTCVYGAITQFVLDWRTGSETFGSLLSIEINRENMCSVMIPPGCGNAYHVKSDQAVYHYKLSYKGDYIDAGEQFTVNWHNPLIKNFPVSGFNPITSERDK
jgi:dTDP-4-dehydrorhamnose 3,5-epimerase